MGIKLGKQWKTYVIQVTTVTIFGDKSFSARFNSERAKLLRCRNFRCFVLGSGLGTEDLACREHTGKWTEEVVQISGFYNWLVVFSHPSQKI